MNRFNMMLLPALLFFINIITAQPVLKVVNLGNLPTTSGQVIKDCKITFRTAGKLSNNHSNVILFPTWFGGTSADLAGIVHMFLDTSVYYVIMVDAFGNGQSSSPSNTADFPAITIRDMVHAEYILLTKHFKFDHIHTVFGISMGGMQALEWAVAYPSFMDHVIPVIGTPRQSSFDIMFWQTAAGILKHWNADPSSEWMYKAAQNVVFLQEFTPEYIASTVSKDSVTAYLNNRYKKEITAPDYLSQINAMIVHDIYKSAGIVPEKIREVISARLYMVVAAKDHVVNPISSYELRDLLDCGLLKLEGDCGHIAALCEAETVKKAVDRFLAGSR
jgi:homoserine O-acetyltransferase